MSTKIEDAVQNLDALMQILKKEDEFNIENAMRMKYASDFKNQELINKGGDLEGYVIDTANYKHVRNRF